MFPLAQGSLVVPFLTEEGRRRTWLILGGQSACGKVVVVVVVAVGRGGLAFVLEDAAEE